MKTKFGIRKNEMSKDMWEFGIVFKHSFETFLVIQLGFIGVSIGKIIDLDELEESEGWEQWE